jgi:hypothetical protein
MQDTQLCEHSPRNKGQSYCAYCRVTELEQELLDARNQGREDIKQLLRDAIAKYAFEWKMLPLAIIEKIIKYDDVK